MTQSFLMINNVGKNFPGVKALDNVSLAVDKGEVLALIGSNGAGKSTLMNILGGILPKDDGEIKIDGKPVHFRNPLDAVRSGISFVHQELSILPTLTVMENMFMGSFPKNQLHLIDFKKAKEQCEEILANLRCSFRATDRAGILGAGDKQMIEIGRALLGNPEIIIFDEPTSSLSNREKEKLFEVIKTLKSQSVAIIYITHFFDEVFEICDQAVVLRNGKTVGGGKISALTYDNIIKYMIGEHNAEVFFHKHEERKGTDEVLKVEKLTRESIIQDISFTLKKGEVVGLWGLLGSGRTELLRAVVGLDKIDSGQIYLKEAGQFKICKPKNVHKQVGFISENRREDGLLLSMSIVHNMSLANLKNHLFKILPFMIHEKKEKIISQTYVNDLKIMISDLKQTIATLSGGNQQKVIISRWLQKNPEIFIMDEPTRGLDIGAKVEIHKIINDLANRGASLLVVSSDIEEIMALSDRFLVMHKGRIVAELSQASTKEQLMAIAATGSLEAI